MQAAFMEMLAMKRIRFHALGMFALGDFMCIYHTLFLGERKLGIYRYFHVKHLLLFFPL